MVRGFDLCKTGILLDLRLGAVLAGAFEQPSGLKAEAHIFVVDKGDYYTIDDGLPQFERSTPDIKVADD